MFVVYCGLLGLSVGGYDLWWLLWLNVVVSGAFDVLV